MSTQAPKPTRRRGTAAEEARFAIETAEADGVARDAMTLRMTLRDASELKRDPKVAMADISYSPDGMRYLGVAVDQGRRGDPVDPRPRRHQLCPRRFARAAAGQAQGDP